MVDRNDPARTGVKAGRVVGLLTAALTVATLWQGRGLFFGSIEAVLAAVGLDPGLPAAVLFWGNLAVAAVSRYVLSYVVGSLVGVLYDWLGRPSLVVLGAIVFAVGVVDGVVSGLFAGSALVGGAYVLAWLCYLPAFAWLYDENAGEDRSGPLRLGDL